MEFACRGRPAADEDSDNNRRPPDPLLPHGTVDTMLVIREALLLQLQKDRLRQEIIMAELAKIDRAMALCSTAHQGVASVHVEQPKPVSSTFSEEFTLHRSRWPAGSAYYFPGADDVHDLKKKDVNHEGVQLKSEKPATENISGECVRPCCSNDKAGDENVVFDQQKLQESNAPKNKPPSLEWELTGITIPVKKPKPLKSWSCTICQVKAPNTDHNLREHCAGKKHRSNVAAKELRNKAIGQKAETTAEPSSCANQKTSSMKWSCSICQVNDTSEVDLKDHINGRTHEQNIEAQFNECDSMSKNAEPQEKKCDKSNTLQYLEMPPCSNCQVNFTSESELGRQLVAKIQALLDAINNIATYSESHEAKSPPNIIPHDAEQTSQWTTFSESHEAKSPPNIMLHDAEQTSQSTTNSESHEASPPNIMPHDVEQSSQSIGSIRQASSDDLLSKKASSDDQSCTSEPQVENPCRARRRRKKREALVGGHDAETGGMKLVDKLFSDGSGSKSISSQEQPTSCHCQVCNLELENASMLADHCKGEEHLEKQKLLNFCWVCNLQCNSGKMLAIHYTGKKHQKNLKANK